MKRKNMKRLLSCLVLSATYLLSGAQGIIVYKTDGTQIKVPYEQLDSISAYAADAGPDVPPGPYEEGVKIEDLTGEDWEDGGLNLSFGYALHFAANQVTLRQGEDVVYQGEYSLEDGTVTFVANGTTYKSAPGLAGDKSVLVMKSVTKNEDGTSEEELAFVLVKKGKAISTKKEDIQGQWLWWWGAGDEEGKIVRISYKFEGDNFELIITPWGQRYTGSYTYEGGIVRLNITAGYTSREEGTGDGWGEGDLDPVTLEGTWRILYKDHWSFESLEGLFLAVGDEAYGFLLMPSICQKKK